MGDVRSLLECSSSEGATGDERPPSCPPLKMIHKYIFDNFLQDLDNKWYFNIDDKLRTILKYEYPVGSYKTLAENIRTDADYSILLDGTS